MPVELQAVGAERVRLDHVRAGGDVGPMNSLDKPGVRDVELVEASVEEHAQLVETGSHCAVEENDALGEDGKEISLHGGNLPGSKTTENAKGRPRASPHGAGLSDY